jgi:ectoine hydroxylase-related dioxygenase (phytanoyl-CoA dioxygenase family)
MTRTQTQPGSAAGADSPVSAADLAFFEQNGYLVVRGLLSAAEVEVLRRRADEVAAPEREYAERNRQRRKEAEQDWAAAGAARAAASGGMDGGMAGGMAGAGMDMGTENMAPGKRADPRSFPDEALDAEHGRRGPYLYIRRTRPIDEAARSAAQTAADPFERSDVTLENLTDNDPVFREYAAHPQVIAVMKALLGPNLKMWYDHLYGKAPYNEAGPYHGANRYHQDGFYFFSERSATCWIALDEVTVEHGPMRYVPLTARYGRFPQFDVLAGIEGGIELAQLRQEVLVPMQPGDVAFHDRMTVHGTGPNETATRRRGWAIHFTRAESRWGDFRDDPEATPYTATQTPDGLHLRNGFVTGNRRYLLVAGEDTPGSV